MATKTYINQIQNPSTYQEYIKQYLDQTLDITNKNFNALANSGQRFGIAADGIIYQSFSLKDCFTDSISDPENYLLQIGTSQNSLNYQLYNKETNTFKNAFSDLSKLQYANVLSIGSDEEISNLLLELQLINYYNVIDPESFIVYDNNKLTIFLKCKNDKHSDFGASLLYIQYNTFTNKLEHFILTEHYGLVGESEDWFICYKLDLNNDGNYNLQIYIFKLSNLVNIISNIFNIDNYNSIYNLLLNFYKFTYNKEISHSSNIFDYDENYNKTPQYLSLFNKAFSDYSLFTKTDVNLNDFRNISFLDFLFNEDIINESISNGNLIYFNNLIIECKKSDNQVNNYRFSTNDNNTQNTLNNILKNKELDEHTINYYLLSINSIDKIYYPLYSYYSIHKYTIDKEALYMSIFINMYNTINNKYLSKQSSNSGILYIPLDLNIHCIVNDMNISNIYYSNNLYVDFIRTSNLNLQTINKITYVHDDCIKHTSIYNFEFNYNNEYKKLVNDISINKLYTLPYINALGKWIVDDNETEFQSYEDQNVGIKQIYLYCSQKESSSFETTILNLSDLNLYKNFKYTTTQFNIHPKFFNKYNDETTSIVCHTQIPTVDASNKEFFENTIIISINDKNNIEDYTNNQKIIQDYGLDYIYSIWKYNNSNNQFEYIKLDDSNYAFDPYNNFTVKTLNNSNKKYLYALIVPSNNIETVSNIEADNYYAISYNKIGNAYNKKYNNNYNYTIEYLASEPSQSGGGYPIPPYNNDKLTDDEKYIVNISDTNVTNVIYPKYKIDTMKITKYTPVFSKLQSLTLKSKTYLTIYVKDSNMTVITELTNKSELGYITKFITKYQSESKEIELGIYIDENNSFYNEYVFNKNVPTIDFKETFIRNNNILNRSNILGIGYKNVSNPNSNIESKAIIYNGYIGTSFNNDYKDILYISTSNENINVGTDTLLGINQFNKFDVYRQLCVNNFKEFNIHIFDKFDNLNNLDSTFEYESDNLFTVTSNRPLAINKNVTTKNQVFNIQSTNIIPYGLLDPYEFIIYGNTNYYSQSYNNDLPLIYYTKYDEYQDNNLSLDDLETFINIKISNLENDNTTYNYDTNNLETVFSCINLNKLFKEVFNINLSSIDPNNSTDDLEQPNYKYIIDNSYNNILSIYSYKNGQTTWYRFLIINNIFENNTPIQIFNHQLNISSYTYNDKVHLKINFDNKENDLINNVQNTEDHLIDLYSGLSNHILQSIIDITHESQTILQQVLQTGDITLKNN